MVPDWCLSSALAFPSDLGARRPCRGLRGWGCAHCQSLPRGELFPRERKRPRLHSQAGASPPRLSAARRESGSRCPWLGEAAPQPECCSVCAQKRLPDRAFPGAVLPPRGRRMCCAGFPWRLASLAQPQHRGTSPWSVSSGQYFGPRFGAQCPERGREEAGCRRVLASLYWEGPSELPHRRSSSSAPRRDSTEPRPRGCSVLGEPPQALPSF